MIKDETLFELIFNSLSLGIILVKKDNTIYAWNKWLENITNISPDNAIGKSLDMIFPLSTRFEWALEQVLKYGHPQIISSLLNKFLFPVSINKSSFSNLDQMPQDIEILPINYKQQDMALVIIKDVSAKVHLKNTLLSMAAKFETSSFVDMLTGCYNRRFLFKYLEAELSTAKRQNYNIICYLFDIDFFKKINDELGHNAGDEVLISFSKLTQSLLRPNDTFFRYGGEEFILISSQVELQDVPRIAHRIRTELEETSSHSGIKRKITCSCGIGYWTPASPPITVEKLINLADIQLYKAKNQGRNCVVMDNHPV
ncbi:diguanylate cyclase domain-containing protein [Legionella sp. D16C41]|uniref:sensor domain-containing diguanylate cyclase n=1 Tax=Legionella sp. D16C41 TaxID=3402688 RepID=UPI003AF41E8A